MVDFVCPAQSWVWLFVFAALCESAFIALLARYYRQSAAVRWLVAFMAADVVYNLATATLGCIANSGLYAEAINVRNLASVLSVMLIVMFSLHFVNKSSWLAKPIVSGPLVMIPIVYMLLLWGGHVYSSDFAQASYVQWGYWVFGTGPLSWVGSLYYGLGLLVPVGLFQWYYRHLDNPQKRKEVNFIRLSFMIPVIIGIIVELILPIMTQTPAFPASTLLSVVANGLISYAIIRYGLHIFNVNDVMADVVHIMPSSLIILDHTLTIQYANKTASEMFGVSASRLTGTSVSKLLKAKDRINDFDNKIINPLRTQGSVIVSDTTFTDHHGKALPVAITASSVRANGQLTNFIIVATDISALKSAEVALEMEKRSVEAKVRQRTLELATAQAQLLASIRGLPFGFALINMEDEIVFHNQHLTELFTLSIPEDVSQTKAILEGLDHDLGGGVALLDLIHRAQHLHKSIEHQAEIGANFYRFFFSPVISMDGSREVLGCVVIAEDITDAKAQERSRDEFFSIASHELRTPLTAIRGNTEIILDYYPEAVKDEAVRQIVVDTHDASVRLIAIVNDFLDASRLEQGKISYKLELFDVMELAIQAVREFDVTGSRRNLALKVEGAGTEEPIIVYADKGRTRQILVNLLANGVKYTAEGGVKVRIDHKDSNTVAVLVSDTGKGIAKKFQHLLFRKFQQATGNILTRDSTRSTGMGLYIARLMAEDMRGTLYLQHSEAGEGSTFALELPVAASQQAAKRN